MKEQFTAVSLPADILTGKETAEGMKSCGASLKELHGCAKRATDGTNDAVLGKIPFGYHYTYARERVNSHKRNPDETVPVSRMQVYCTFWGKDGSEQKYPWTFVTGNFGAMPIYSANGTTQYDSDSIRNRKRASIRIANGNMYPRCGQINHAVLAWEIMASAPDIRYEEEERLGHW